MKISVKGLLFDYGGTIDTQGVHWAEVIWKYYQHYQIAIEYDVFRKAYVEVERHLGKNNIITSDMNFLQVLQLKIQLQFDVLNLNNSKLVHSIATDCYQEAANNITKIKPLLKCLKEKYPIALVSNFYGNLNSVLKDFKLIDLFDIIIESASVNIRKPDPAIFQLAIDHLHLNKNEVVIIGDSYKNDIHPAEEIGCPSIWLRNKSWNEKDDFIIHPAIISDLQELKKYLL